MGRPICQCIFLAINAMLPDARNFIILLCLIPGDVTRQGKSAATQRSKT